LSRDWRAYAAHILDSVDKLERIQARGDILTDDILYDAALRNLQTLAEATQNLPAELKAAHGEIDWKNIAAFRNILVHNYLGTIDPVTVKRVIGDHIEPLAKAVRLMLAK
jgi:uncharacterized protein with HEPN domain